jgi:hypothetical protein
VDLPSLPHRQNRCLCRRRSPSAKRQSRTRNRHRRSVRPRRPRLRWVQLAYPIRRTDRHAACRYGVTACSPRPLSGECAPRRRTDFVQPQRSKRNPRLLRKKKPQKSSQVPRSRLPPRPSQRQGREKKAPPLPLRRRRCALAPLLLRHHLGPGPSQATVLRRRHSHPRHRQSRGARPRLVRHRPRCGVHLRSGECLPRRRPMRPRFWQPAERLCDPSRRTGYPVPRPLEQRQHCRPKSNRHPLSESLRRQERARAPFLANQERLPCTLTLAQARRRHRPGLGRTPVRSLRRYPSSKRTHDPLRSPPQAHRFPLLLRSLHDVDRCPFRLRRSGRIESTLLRH